MQEQNWWTVFLFPPWWCVLLHSRDTGWMKWANFARKNILIHCTIRDLLLREQGNHLAFITNLEQYITHGIFQFTLLLLLKRRLWACEHLWYL